MLPVNFSGILCKARKAWKLAKFAGLHHVPIQGCGLWRFPRVADPRPR